MEYCDLSSGDESDSDLDLGLFRAASNCGPEAFFAMDAETRSQYRSYDRVRHRVRKGKPQKPKPKKEVAKAAVATDDGTPTIFDKIISREIPCTILYEDDDALAFKDVNPQVGRL